MNTLIESRIIMPDGIEHLSPNRREPAVVAPVAVAGVPSLIPADAVLIQGSITGLQYTTTGGNFSVQLGWDGGYQETGYSSNCSLTNAASGFAEAVSTGMSYHINLNTRVLSASLLIVKVNAATNSYNFRISGFYEDGEWSGASAGQVTLPQPATRVRLIGSGGSTFNFTSLGFTYH